mmetsp:Transcript_14398/g.46032  ORF Transcript_14398/g.46032 Transcript_14398/m.46032 type:complete len:244 (+) Transcript_14398:46-777(+)
MPASRALLFQSSCLSVNSWRGEASRDANMEHGRHAFYCSESLISPPSGHLRNEIGVQCLAHPLPLLGLVVLKGAEELRTRHRGVRVADRPQQQAPVLLKCGRLPRKVDGQDLREGLGMLPAEHPQQGLDLALAEEVPNEDLPRLEPVAVRDDYAADACIDSLLRQHAPQELQALEVLLGDATELEDPEDAMDRLRRVLGQVHNLAHDLVVLLHCQPAAHTRCVDDGHLVLDVLALINRVERLR